MNKEKEELTVNEENLTEEIKKIIDEAITQTSVNLKNKYSNVKMDCSIKDRDGIVFSFRNSSSDEKAFVTALMGIMSLFDKNSKFKLEIDARKNELRIPLDFSKLLRTARR